MVKLNATGITSIDEIGQQTPPAPGRYHVIIQDVDATFEKSESIVVGFVVLGGTVPGQEGREAREWFSLSEKAMPRLTQLALVTGLLKPGDEADVDFELATGKQLIIELDENKYISKKDGSEKTNVRITYAGMWPLGHKDVSDVPRGDATSFKPSAKRNTAKAADELPATEDKNAAADTEWDDVV